MSSNNKRHSIATTTDLTLSITLDSQPKDSPVENEDADRTLYEKGNATDGTKLCNIRAYIQRALGQNLSAV